MAQADLNVANQSGAGFRSDLNNQLLALGTLQSGASAPSTPYAYMLWADTTNDLLKIRNAANSAWISLGTLSATNLGNLSTSGGTLTGALLVDDAGTAALPAVAFDTDPDTGLFRKAANQLGIGTAGAERGYFDASGWNGPVVGAVTTTSINGGQLAGTRNRIINGGMAVDQRNAGASQTFTAAAALAYSVDRWYGYCTGANVTGQRVTGATAGQYRYQFTGAASVTGIGFGQRIEQLNSTDLANTTATLSVDLANSLLTTVTWTAYYASTADTFSSRTQFATGTFTVNSTVTRYSTQISVSASATTGIEIVFTVGAQTSGTWTIGNVQLEAGSVATPFERRSYGQELALCQRYYWRVSHPFTSGNYNSYIAGGYVTDVISHPVEMRATPTCVTNTTGIVLGSLNAPSASGMSPRASKLNATSTVASANCYWTSVAGNYFDASAEL